MSSIKRFQTSSLLTFLIEDLRFDFNHEDVCKRYCLFGDHGGSMRSQILLFFELESICTFSSEGLGGGGASL